MKEKGRTLEKGFVSLSLNTKSLDNIFHFIIFLFVINYYCRKQKPIKVFKKFQKILLQQFVKESCVVLAQLLGHAICLVALMFETPVF